MIEFPEVRAPATTVAGRARPESLGSGPRGVTGSFMVDGSVTDDGRSIRLPCQHGTETGASEPLTVGMNDTSKEIRFQA